MTAPTHGVFILMIMLGFGVGLGEVGWLMVLGALLPDIDHPQSTIGRVFFFISHPLNKAIGHRTLTHSLLLWIVLTWGGWFWFRPLFWIGLGAFSHLFLDCWNLSGVSLFKPLTDKVFVMAGRKFRFRVGSREEMILMVCLLLLCWGSFSLAQAGGLRGAVREMLGDYSIAIDQYQRAGQKISYMEGRVRYPTGEIREGSWMIIGQNHRHSSLSLFDEQEGIVVTTDEVFFMRAILRPSEEVWQSLKLTTPMKLVNGEAFYKVDRRWHRAEEGDLVFGQVVYKRNIELE